MTDTDAGTETTRDSGMEQVALARQPILDRTGALVAYELLFRRVGEATAIINDRLSATAHVIHNAFAVIGLADVLGPYLGFVNVDADFLHSEYLSLLPAGQVVLELLEDIDAGPEVVARCTALKAQGYRLALDDFDGSRRDLNELLTLTDVVKVDLTLVADADLRPLVASLRKPGRQLLAEKVETQKQFKRCLALGFELFQGYHFARPQTLSARRPLSNRVALLHLLSLLMRDAETGLLEAEFKHHPELSVNLLRMVNSAAMGLQGTISSMRQAIVMLGRRRLQAWLQLLVHTAGDSRGGIPLLQMACVRGRLLELMAEAQRPEDVEFHDEAFMVGIFSLMDALLDMPMQQIVTQIRPTEAIRLALLQRRGDVGVLLTLAERLEADDVPGVDALLQALPASVRPKLLGLQLEAFQWANTVSASIRPANSSR